MSSISLVSSPMTCKAPPQQGQLLSSRSATTSIRGRWAGRAPRLRRRTRGARGRCSSQPPLPAPPRLLPRSARGPRGRAAAGRDRASPNAGRTARVAVAGSGAAASRSRLALHHARREGRPARPGQCRVQSRDQ
jgi:hypothetical protein